MSNLDLKTMMEEHRRDELRAVFRFIALCNTEELGRIVEEIRCVHDCLYTFNQDTKLFAKVESISLNGDGIQLNIEKEIKDE